MSRRKLAFGWGLALAALLLACSPATSVWGQNNNNNNGGNNNNNNNNNNGGNPGFLLPAGVEVDAAGVLRMKIAHDPAGVLTRERIAAARAELPADLMRPSKLRKVSLNRLEAAIAEKLKAGDKPSDEMLYLAGLTRLQYVFYYPQTKEIVLAGPAEGFMVDLTGRPLGLATGRCILELQDLVTALRAFPPAGDGAGLIGCSIDPTPEGLANMQKFLSRVGGTISPGQGDEFAAGVRDSLGLQKITVKGVAPQTHFAQVLVEADYRMKLIGIGLERPPAKIASWVSMVNPGTVAKNALQRWYFTPNYECVRVSDDELAMELVGDGVKLISEDEMVKADGAREKSGLVNKASETFVKSFTENYPELAAKSPVYAQLRNLIDMTIAAAYIQKQDYYGESDWDLGVLASEDQFPVETFPAPKHVAPAVNAIWRGRRLMTPIGGGVSIRPTKALDSDNLLADEEGAVKGIHSQITTESLKDGQWWWD